MSYVADITVRVSFTREPSDYEAEIAAENIASWLKAHTAVPKGRTSDRADQTRIGVVDAEVIDWDGQGRPGAFE